MNCDKFRLFNFYRNLFNFIPFGDILISFKMWKINTIICSVVFYNRKIYMYIFLILTFKVINITIFIRGQIKIFIKKNSLKSNIYNNIQY